jgi:uncharacterized protein with PQ loop repeat
VRTIQRAGSTLQYSFAPFFFFFVQSLIYTVYAYVTANPLMGGSSFLSSVLGCHYVYIFCKHANDRTRPVQYVAISLSLLVLLSLHALRKSREESQLLIGIPGNILSLLTSASPLLQVKKIIRTQDASCLPFGMSVMTVVAGGLWLLYGLLLQDPLIIYPNAFALTMGLIQVALIVRYGAGPHTATEPKRKVVKTVDETPTTTGAVSGTHTTTTTTTTVESIVQIFTRRKSFHEKV